MSTYFPSTENELLTINGVGRFKLKAYGEKFLHVIKEFCLHNQITRPNVTNSAAKPVKPEARPIKSDTSKISLMMYREGQSVENIAKSRNLTAGTIIGHLLQEYENGEKIDFEILVPKNIREAIDAAIEKAGGIEKL